MDALPRGTFWFLLAWKSYGDFLPEQHSMFWREGTLAPLSDHCHPTVVYVLIVNRDSSGSQTGDLGHDDTGIAFLVVRFCSDRRDDDFLHAIPEADRHQDPEKTAALCRRQTHTHSTSTHCSSSV